MPMSSRSAAPVAVQYSTPESKRTPEALQFCRQNCLGPVTIANSQRFPREEIYPSEALLFFSYHHLYRHNSSFCPDSCPFQFRFPLFSSHRKSQSSSSLFIGRENYLPKRSPRFYREKASVSNPLAFCSVQRKDDARSGTGMLGAEGKQGGAWGAEPETYKNIK